MADPPSKVLSFVVSSALLGAPALSACGSQEPDNVNEPAPVHETINEPARTVDEVEHTSNEPAETDPPVAEPDDDDTVNEPAPD